MSGPQSERNDPAVSRDALEVLMIGRVGVDLYPEQSGVPLAQVRTFAKSLGGTATNVAVAAARLGRRSAVLTKVGADGFGDYVRMALGEFGVSSRYVSTSAELRTPVVFCELNPPADPPLLFYRAPIAPDLTLTGYDIPWDVIGSVPLLWVTGTGVSAEPARGTQRRVLEYRARHGHTVLDLDYRPMFWPDEQAAGRAIGELLEYVNVVVGNRTEVRVAVGTDDPGAAAERLIERGVGLAVIKCGADGVFVADAHGNRWTVPPCRVEVVCGLGAGDGFGGALVHGLLAGWEPPRIAEYANAAGALVASRLACADAMPTATEIEELLGAQRNSDEEMRCT
ncbi:5-dehydro-2-deoxygluconokinase [Nocardia macrotermitis]|uniref:5-dehydro-2-deoxygluconokinase n=1 Tax=Nocardia macrotermitis TaxID=2585198 RepID=A0A7K0CY35_9NOCA|nr:5-dehydro-2-deoxygluconokinase [Nocardia macrotermitis]MQY18417.1 5-dehydro-2-deoxygluconokinase [Nocardia macrotermitis]